MIEEDAENIGNTQDGRSTGPTVRYHSEVKSCTNLSRSSSPSMHAPNNSKHDRSATLVEDDSTQFQYTYRLLLLCTNADCF